MSSSYRNFARGGCALLALASVPAFAADVSFRPEGEAGVEYNSNRDLRFDNAKASEGYSLDVGGTLKIATPLSTTTIRPVIGYVDYPDADENSLQSVLDLQSVRRGERTTTSLFGRFDRRDTYNSELASSEFNPINPNLPTTPETGRISANGKRTLITAVPTFRYAVNERAGWNLSGTVQSVDYSGDGAGTRYVPYTYYSASTSVDWQLSPLSNLAVGVFGTRSDNKDDDGKADGKGVNAVWTQRPNERYTGRFELNVSRDDVTTIRPVTSRDQSTNIGANYTGSFRGQISRVDLSIGRTITPSGAGGTFRADQVQVEYRRDLSPRTEFMLATRYIKYATLASGSTAGDYDYLNARMGLKRMVTRTWYLSGSLEYLREKFKGTDGGTANNGRAFVSIGYEGLQR